MNRRITLALFVLLAALQIAPAWSVRYLPTGDGATHIYNAWVLHGLLTDTAPPNIERAYRIDWRPHPNWTGHALMALFIAVVPPLVAEKLLVTLCLALLFFGAWHLATTIDPRSGIHAFFIFPFAWSQTLVAGYYNYSLSVGLFLIILAAWWRRRMLLVTALLVVCYFTHPMATLLACGAVTLLSLTERRFAHILSIVPVAPLLIFFGGAEQSNVGKALDLHIEWGAARIIGAAEVIQSLDGGQQRFISFGVTALFAILCIVTIRQRQRADALALLVLAFAAMMFWLPAPSGTRDLFTQRTSQFLFPVLAAWLTPHLAKRGRIAVAAALSVLSIANLAIVWRHVRIAGADNAHFVSTFRAIEPETTVLPLFFTREESGTMVDLFIHRISYVALEKRLVDYGNYEPGTGYFPVVWRDANIDTASIEGAPAGVDIVKWAPRAEYVVTASMPPGAAQKRDLDHRYRLLRASERFRIYRRNAPLRGDFETILLPLLGTRTDLGAPAGARWRVDQRVINRGEKPLRVIFEHCLDDIPCDFPLAPQEMIPIAATGRRFVRIRVLKGTAQQLQIDTVVRRTDVERPDLSIPIPAAHERDFQRGNLRIENVRAGKIGLRVYLFGPRDWYEGTVRIGSQVIPFETDVFYENTSLSSDTETDIEIAAPDDAQLWAFATSANENGQTLLHLPVVSTAHRPPPTNSPTPAPARATTPPSPRPTHSRTPYPPA